MKVQLIFSLLLVNSQVKSSGVNLFFFGLHLRDFKVINPLNVEYNFQSLHKKYYNPSRRNFLFIHGWQPVNDEDTLRGMIGAYLNYRRTEYNIIYLDWSAEASNIDYLEVVSKITPVTKTANEILSQMHSQGFDISQTHICGFSFGAVISGGIGRFFKYTKGLEFPRITGLDPGEFYNTMNVVYPKFGIIKLNTDAAKFVDLIHTNADGIGDGLASHGHVEFWPNGGRDQPGCRKFSKLAFIESFHSWTDFVDYLGCSHIRAWEYYAESVTRNSTSPGFISSKCSIKVTTKIIYALQCRLSSSVSMGYYADVTTRNRNDFVSYSYWLKTNNESLYSLT